MMCVSCVPVQASCPGSLTYVMGHTPLTPLAMIDEFLDYLCRDTETMTEEEWINYQVLWEKIKLESLYNE